MNTLRCPVTQLEIGDTLDDALRYAESVAGRLESGIEALEALGMTRRAAHLQGWLERWLLIVEVLFDEKIIRSTGDFAPKQISAYPVA
jgi:hypothetical protein